MLEPPTCGASTVDAAVVARDAAVVSTLSGTATSPLTCRRGVDARHAGHDFAARHNPLFPSRSETAADRLALDGDGDARFDGRGHLRVDRRRLRRRHLRASRRGWGGLHRRGPRRIQRACVFTPCGGRLDTRRHCIVDGAATPPAEPWLGQPARCGGRPGPAAGCARAAARAAARGRTSISKSTTTEPFLTALILTRPAGTPAAVAVASLKPTLKSSSAGEDGITAPAACGRVRH